jgi:c-di-GMP-binding flagellar brake protein YcgR
MTASKFEDADASERRNYFRLEDRVYVEYRPSDQQERDQWLRERAAGVAKGTDLGSQLDSVSRQIAPLLISVRNENPTVAQYLEGLNRKIDILANNLFFEQFRNPASKEEYTTTSTVDISEGGVGFDAPMLIPLDSVVYCRVVIAGYRFGLETYGNVVYCREMESDGNSQFRIGVEFPYLTEYDRKQLTRYIFDRQRQQIRKQRTESPVE